MKKIFFRGLATGLMLQLAIGPVFLFIANISFQNGVLDALSAVVAVTIVDYIYILLAIMGVGKIIEKEKIKRVFTIISSVILTIFGIFMVEKGMNILQNNIHTEILNNSLYQSFTTAFILTISSPLTIVFWTSIFTAKTIEYSMNKKELAVFGTASGIATLLFLGVCVIILSFMKKMIPDELIRILNVLVGLILIWYAVMRSIKNLYNNKKN